MFLSRIILSRLYFKSFKNITKKKKKFYEAWFNYEYFLYHLKIFESECFIEMKR